jgi:ferrous-iron efflux pump FieF
MFQSAELRGLRNTLILYIVIFILKLAVYFASGVMALLAEALHTLADIFVSSFLLVAAIYSLRKADQVHMFGYGRAQNVAALVAATLFISFTSFELYREALPRLFVSHPAEYKNLGWVIAVLLVSMGIAAYPLVGFLRSRAKGGGAAAKAQMMELINDQMGLFAALLGTLAITLGFPLGDPLGALVVATIITVNAVGLFRENLSYLIGKAPDPARLAEMEQAALSVPGVLAVHKLRSESVGPEIFHTQIHVRVHPQMAVVDANQIAEEVERRICPGDSSYCIVHLDAARPEDLVTPST